MASQPTWTIPPLLVPRIPQASTGASSTSSLVPTSVPSTTETSDRSALAKSIIEWLLISVLFILVGVLLVRRIMHLRHSRQPLRNFFTSGQTNPTNNTNTLIARLFPRSTDLPTTSPTQSNPFHPSRISFPSPYDIHHSQLHTNLNPYPRHGIRALDIDASGRRLAPDGEMVINDHDGVFNDKDVLPAYDRAGGPPKYLDLHVSGCEGTGVDGRVQRPAVGAQVQLGMAPPNISPETNVMSPSPAYEAGSDGRQAVDLPSMRGRTGHSPTSGVDSTSTSLPSAPQPTTTSPPPPPS